MTFSDNFTRMLEHSRGGIGQWIIIRHFSNVRSEYWNEKAQESIGGPPNTYTDTVVLSSKQLTFDAGRPPSKTGLNVLQPVNAMEDSFRYFLSPSVTISVDDEIFDLDASGDIIPTPDYTKSGVGAPITDRFKVAIISTYRVGNKGEKTYIVAFAKRYYAE